MRIAWLICAYCVLIVWLLCAYCVIIVWLLCEYCMLIVCLLFAHCVRISCLLCAYCVLYKHIWYLDICDDEQGVGGGGGGGDTPRVQHVLLRQSRRIRHRPKCPVPDGDMCTPTYLLLNLVWLLCCYYVIIPH